MFIYTYVFDLFRANALILYSQFLVFLSFSEFF